MSLNLDQLQGSWDVIELEVEGTAMSSTMFTGSSIVVTGNRFATIGMGTEFAGVLSGNDDVVPNTLDINFLEGPHAGKASLALFELDDEVWKLCLCLAGGTRPTGFKTTPGSGHVLEVLKRSQRTTSDAPVPSAPEHASAETIQPLPISQTEEPDLELMSGTWSMVSGVRNGEALPAQFATYGKRVATSTEVTVSFGPQVYVKASYMVNTTSLPKHIDYILTGGPDQGKTLLGIYELDGDTLKTFMSAPGDTRPDSFMTTPGDGRTLAVWSRCTS